MGGQGPGKTQGGEYAAPRSCSEDQGQAPVGEPALRDFLEQLRPRFRALFARYQIPRAETEDLLQQTLLAWLLKSEGIRNHEAWLIGTVRKHCLLYWRQRRRALYDAVDACVLEALASPESPEQERREWSQDFDRLVSSLPSRCRRLFQLRYREGLKPGEIAERLGYRQASMGKVTSRCMDQLLRRVSHSGSYLAAGTPPGLRSNAEK